MLLRYWGLEQYNSTEAKGAAAGLVAQSKALLLKEWHGYGGNNSYAGVGRCVALCPSPTFGVVFENYRWRRGISMILDSHMFERCLKEHTCI
jgi:hypothetical protein